MKFLSTTLALTLVTICFGQADSGAETKLARFLAAQMKAQSSQADVKAAADKVRAVEAEPNTSMIDS